MEKILSRPRIKLSILQTSRLDAAETGVLVSDFGQQFCRKNVDVPCIYFFSRCWYFSNSGSESNC